MEENLRWARQILLEDFKLVLEVRQILKTVASAAVEAAEKSGRRTRAGTAQTRAREKQQEFQNRMEVVDTDRESRIEKAKEKQLGMIAMDIAEPADEAMETSDRVRDAKSQRRK